MSQVAGKTDCPENDVTETYTFTLRLSVTGDRTFDDDIAQSIHEACPDAMLAIIAGEVYLNVDRESPTIQTAIASAIRDVEGTGFVKVTAILPPNDTAIQHYNALLKLRNEAGSPKELRAMIDRALKEGME